MSYPQPSQSIAVGEERPGARESSRRARLAPAASPRSGLSADALRYHFLAERLNEVVFHLDRQGHFTFLSPAWTSLTGLSVESALGQSLMQRVHPEDQKDVQGLLESIAARVQASFRLEVRLLASRGAQWVELAAFSSPTGQGELLGTLTDITERRQLQARLQQADRMATLGMLVPGFAHEMNNPLAFMAANLDYLLSSMGQASAGAPASEVAAWREAVEEILEGSERLRRTLGHLRGFRPEPGQGPVDVNLLLDTVGQLVSSALHSRGRLVRDYGARSLVPGGEGSLRQALLNLVLHAVLSLPDEGENSEAHEVRLVTRDDGQGHVVVEVHDTGPGLAPELLPHVFEPLFPSGGGHSTGPALSVCRDIVRELGGGIEVTSSRGRGTTFRVTLPGVS
jgi:two-component system, NtrC family, sensor kinase